MAAKKPPTKAEATKVERTKQLGKTNTFSRIAVPKVTQVPKAPGPVEADMAVQTKQFGKQRRSFVASETGRERLAPAVQGTDLRTGERTTFDSPATRIHVARNMGLGLGHDVSSGPAVPDINAPHEVNPDVVGQRRWEDLHPNEQKSTLAAAARHGVTMASAKRDYSSQLEQSHVRANRAGQANPYSELFYSGPSRPRDVLTSSAMENARHPNWPAGVDPHKVQAVANSITSPRNYFEREGSGGGKIYPNDEHANTAIRHVLDMGPHSTPQQAYDSVPNNTGPSGGGIHGNIKRAAYAAHQMIYGGRSTHELRNPLTEKQAEKGQTKGNPSFGGPTQQKTTAYASAWMQPHDPDAFLTTDVHTAHGFAAHLSTAKDEGGKSQVEQYVEKTPNVHAFHDHIARQVHHEMGFSPSPANTQYLHRGQAAQWGEERIQRADLTDATQEKAYPHQGPTWRQPLDVSHLASGTLVRGAGAPARVQHVEPDTGGGDRDKLERGIAARSAATVKKRGVKPAGDEHFADDDPWAPRNQR